MLSKGKALYQVKLILDYLPREEYELIPKDKIKYIEENFEYDENIKVDQNIPLEKQNIDEKTYKILDEIVKSIENNKNSNIVSADEISEYVANVKEKNKEFDVKIENIRLNNLIELLRKENGKIPKARELIEEYKVALKQKEAEIENLKKKNEQLYEEYKKIPSFIRKIFIKNDIKFIE